MNSHGSMTADAPESSDRHMIPISTAEPPTLDNPTPSACAKQAASRPAVPTLLWAVGIGLPLTILCAPTLIDLIDLWWNRYGFSHGFLVLPLALYLAWLQQPTLRRLPTRPSILVGSVWLIGAVGLLIAGTIGGVITIAGLALILLPAGLIFLFYGTAHVKTLALPLSYLILMTPVLDLVTQPLEWPFQRLTAEMSVLMMRALGMPALLQHDIFIVLPTATLEVARECSGAGLLIAVSAIALPVAVLTLQARWSRLTLMAGAVAVAIMANWIRLTIMGLYAQAGGKDLHGPYHLLQGLFVDWTAFAFLFLGTWVLSRFDHPPHTTQLPEAAHRPLPADMHAALRNIPLKIAFGILSVAAGTLLLLTRNPHADRPPLSGFPPTVGAWAVDRTAQPPVLVALPDTDDALIRTYRSFDGRKIDLFIGYVAGQRHGKELVGQPTVQLHEEAVAATVLDGAASLRVNHTILKNGRRRLPTVFWYQINGTGYTDRVEAKLGTILQAFHIGRTDGALIVISDHSQTGDRDDQWRTVDEFASSVAPLVRAYVP